MIVFGSFARDAAGRESDVDIVVVRPDEINEDDEDWSASIESWRNEATATADNTVQILEVSATEAQSRLHSNTQLWRDIQRDGVVVHELTIRKLSESIHASADAHQARVRCSTQSLANGLNDHLIAGRQCGVTGRPVEFQLSGPEP